MAFAYADMRHVFAIQPGFSQRIGPGDVEGADGEEELNESARSGHAPVPRDVPDCRAARVQDPNWEPLQPFLQADRKGLEIQPVER